MVYRFWHPQLTVHSNVLNNGKSIGDRMCLTRQDIICCPPPLYHCFGLVLGLLACVTHGSCFVLPSPTFQASATMDCMIKYECTGLLGVPTMLLRVLTEHENRNSPPVRLRTGIAAGAPVSRALLERLQSTFGCPDFINVYGMYQVSGFIAFLGMT
jgi:long-chain acyl-CoA synthetase